MKRSIGVAVAAMSWLCAAHAAPADDVRSLLEQGREAEAYRLGRSQPAEWGNPAFDFYFGIAAIQAGAAGEGVLALERYLLQFPQNRSAQFQLARGYYVLGEDLRAREEFEALLPGAAGAERDAIVRYLDALRARESRYRPTASFHAELGVGRDSNVNSGVAAGQVAGLPEGFVVTPGQSSERVKDAFGTWAAGWQASYPVRPGLSVYGGVGAAGRTHGRSQNDVYDTASLSLQTGLTVVRGRQLWRIGLDAAALRLDNQRYLDAATVGAEWQLQLDASDRIGAHVQWGVQDYHDIVSYLDQAKTVPASSQSGVRDASVGSVTAHWTHAFTGSPWTPVLQASVQAGRERNRHDRPDLSRDLRGARVSVSAQPRAGWAVGAGAAWQGAEHQADFASGIGPRRDRSLTLDLSATYALDRQWSLRADLLRTWQRSSVGLYEFDRTQVGMKLRYEMN